MNAGASGGLKVMAALELEVLMVVSHLMWMLATQLGSSGRTASALNN